MPPLPALPQDADGLLKLAAQSMFDLYAQTQEKGERGAAAK